LIKIFNCHGHSIMAEKAQGSSRKALGAAYRIQVAFSWATIFFENRDQFALKRTVMPGRPFSNLPGKMVGNVFCG
jgi:hypothetical protein